MKNMKKALTLPLAIVAGVIAVYATGYPSGLPGLFSINAHGGQVRFAQGNLQYLAALGETVHPDGTSSGGTWRFALNQYDCAAMKNKDIASDYSDWIDMFGWGTSGFNNTANDPCASYYQPYSSSNDSTDCEETNVTGYGPSTDQSYRGLAGPSAYYDWGVYNTISNSEAGVAWRSLTYGEWFYLLFSRPNAADLRSQATIHKLHGYVLLPDNWESPEGLTFTAHANDWKTNTYSVAQWKKMEEAGAVFLPAAGERRGAQIGWGNVKGFYWTASASNQKSAYVIHFNDTTLHTAGRSSRAYGHPVRLVCDVNRQTDPQAKFAGFDIRGTRMGEWIYNNGGFRDLQNLTVEDSDPTRHKYNLRITTGGQECSFTLGGVQFVFKNSESNKIAFRTTNSDIRPDGKDRKIIIPTAPGDEILVSIADSTDYPGLQAEGVTGSSVDLKAGDNILRATGEAIVLTTSNAEGQALKVKINAILCLSHQ